MILGILNWLFGKKSPSPENKTASLNRANSTASLRSRAVVEISKDTASGDKDSSRSMHRVIMPGIESEDRLGSILLKYNMITYEQLHRALQLQNRSRPRKFLGEVLVDEKMLTEEVLVSALSRQFKIPYMQVDKYKIPKEVIKLVPYEIAKKNLLIPLHKIGQLLTIGMINPQNTEPIEELKRITGLKVKFVICKLSEIKEAIRVLYETKEVSTQMTTALKIQKKPAPSGQTKTGMSISELKLPTPPDETGVIKTPAIAAISTADGQAKVKEPTKTQVSSVVASESQKNVIQLTEEEFELAYREVSAKLPVL